MKIDDNLSEIFNMTPVDKVTTDLVITEDGEVIESGDARDFILKLKDIPAPSSKTRNDNSTNAFEYICRKIKLEDYAIKTLNERLEACIEYTLGNELIEYEVDEMDENEEF